MGLAPPMPQHASFCFRDSFAIIYRAVIAASGKQLARSRFYLPPQFCRPVTCQKSLKKFLTISLLQPKTRSRSSLDQVAGPIPQVAASAGRLLEGMDASAPPFVPRQVRDSAPLYVASASPSDPSLSAAADTGRGSGRGIRGRGRARGGVDGRGVRSRGPHETAGSVPAAELGGAVHLNAQEPQQEFPDLAVGRRGRGRGRGESRRSAFEPAFTARHPDHEQPAASPHDSVNPAEPMAASAGAAGPSGRGSREQTRGRAGDGLPRRGRRGGEDRLDVHCHGQPAAPAGPDVGTPEGPGGDNGAQRLVSARGGRRGNQVRVPRSEMVGGRGGGRAARRSATEMPGAAAGAEDGSAAETVAVPGGAEASDSDSDVEKLTCVICCEEVGARVPVCLYVC